MSYRVTHVDGTSEDVGADGYVAEGTLTTFFTVEAGRRCRFDAWSTKVLSLRTDQIASIRQNQLTGLP